MEIATNAVFAALLLQASAFVKDMDLGLPTPLEGGKVRAFRFFTTWGKEGKPELACYLAYGRGYEFRHDHGRILSFSTPDSYTRLQDPDQLVRFLGEPRYSESECLAKAKNAVRRLGYTNASILTDQPKVITPTFKRGNVGIPRYIFQWVMKGPNKLPMELLDAEIEVDASRLTIENLSLETPQFWGEPWPLTFGTTNVYEEPDPTEPKRADLELQDVSPENAMVFVQAALPAISDFCAKLGPPIPKRVELSDVVMGGSEVAVKNGQLTASLRLKSGHLVIFYAGHVRAVKARDELYNHPASRKYVKESPEYTAPITMSKEQAKEKVRQILLGKLGLPERALYLDTEPVFALVPEPGATSGVRRYCFYWQRPETLEQRDERRRNQVPPEVSVSAEVDAVSGDIKALSLAHNSLQEPDPNFNAPPDRPLGNSRP